MTSLHAAVVFTLAGWLAGALTLASGVPQVVKLLRTRDTQGVSTWTFTVWTMVAMWWATWGLDVGSVPSYVVNLLCLPVLITAVVLLHPSRTQFGLLAITPLATITLTYTWVPGLIVGGSLLQGFLALPSARLALRRGADLSGVSLPTWVLVIVSNVLWFVFDVGIGFPQAGIVGLLAAAVALVIIVQVRGRRLSIR